MGSLKLVEDSIALLKKQGVLDKTDFTTGTPGSANKKMLTSTLSYLLSLPQVQTLPKTKLEALSKLIDSLQRKRMLGDIEDITIFN